MQVFGSSVPPAADPFLWSEARRPRIGGQSGHTIAAWQGLLPDAIAALKSAEEIGLPVMIKSSAAGGGIGLQLCRTASELAERYESVKRLGEENFKQSGVYIEKFVELARHIEVQIFGDGNGNVIAIGERDCSIQRRNQKVIEETPAPGISQEIRSQLSKAATLLGKSVRYTSAGTVEFIYDGAPNKNSIFWRLTRGFRSSTGSPKKSRGLTSWNG
jgi:urea carboxylase